MTASAPDEGIDELVDESDSHEGPNVDAERPAKRKRPTQSKRKAQQSVKRALYEEEARKKDVEAAAARATKDAEIFEEAQRTYDAKLAELETKNTADLAAIQASAGAKDADRLVE